MGNSKLHDLRDKLMEELEKHSKAPEISAQSLEAVYKLSESIKAIDTICAMEEYDEDDGYSGRRGGRSYRPRYSYRSYDDGRAHMIHKLNNMANEATSEHVRNVLQNAASQLEMN